MTPSLEALLLPMTMAAFRRHFERHEHAAVHRRPSAVQVPALPSLSSLSSLLSCWPQPIQAHLPDVADEASSITTTAHDAVKLFASGMSLLFNHAEALDPALPLWLKAIRSDLGLSSLTMSRCLVYATPAGKGTAPHFDQNLNFVLQLSGEKTWTLANNDHVQHPLTRHTMGLDADPELASYARAPLPKRMPAKRHEVVMKPGSLLFVPRGMWHATHAHSDALSLNFTFTAPSWLDVLLSAARGRLAQSPEWRATATPHDAGLLDELLAELGADVQGWSAEQILGVTEASDD